MGQFLRALGRPHLSDVLYHPKILSQLSAQWPTFTFLRPRATSALLKQAPVHLYGYMDFSTSDSVCLDIIQLGGIQEEEEKAIAGVLWDLPENVAPVMSASPLAMALICYLYRGASWLIKHQNEILPTILQSSSASYIALCSGFFQGDVKALFQKIVEDPRLTREIWQNPILRRMADEDQFMTVLGPHPVQKAAWLFLKGQSTDAITLLQQSAGSDTVCAGVCLGLDPASERADDWLAVVAGSPEAFFWMGKVWRSGGNEIEAHPHRLAAWAGIRRDLRWVYHWLRDVAPDQASRHVLEFGFSPWIVELIVDLGLSPGLALDLYNNQILDPKQSLDSALLLWAADFIPSASS